MELPLGGGHARVTVRLHCCHRCRSRRSSRCRRRCQPSQSALNAPACSHPLAPSSRSVAVEIHFYLVSPAIMWIAVDRSTAPRRWGLAFLVAASLVPVLAQGILMARLGAGPDVFTLLGSSLPPTYVRPYWRCPVGCRAVNGGAGRCLLASRLPPLAPTPGDRGVCRYLPSIPPSSSFCPAL